MNVAPLRRLPFRAILIADDAVYRVSDDGELELIPPPGHPRPAGLSCEPSATRRRRAA